MVKVWLLLILLPAVLLHVALGSPSGPLDTCPHMLHVLPASQSLSHPSYLLETFIPWQCPCTVLSLAHSCPRIPPSSHPPYHLLLTSLLCLISSGPGKRTACPRVAESSSSKLCHPEDFCCSFVPGCLSLSVFLPAVLHILPLPVYSKGAPWPDIGYHPAGYQLHSHIWGHNFFLIQGNFRLPLFRLVAPCLFLAKIAGIGKHM